MARMSAQRSPQAGRSSVPRGVETLFILEFGNIFRVKLGQVPDYVAYAEPRIGKFLGIIGRKTILDSLSLPVIFAALRVHVPPSEGRNQRDDENKQVKSDTIIGEQVKGVLFQVSDEKLKA